MIQFTNYVGTSPGTTTMEVPAMNGLGVCPPGWYGDAIMLPGATKLRFDDVTPSGPSENVAVIPYGTESKLAGLRGTTPWGMLVLGFGVAFAGVLGYALYKRGRK